MRNNALVLLFMLATPNTVAQTFEESSSLDLGRIAVIRNNSEGSLSVNRFDKTSHSDHFRVITPGKAGVYLLSNVPANTGFFFSASVRSIDFQNNPGVETFTIDSLDYDTYQVSDSAGKLFFKIGATIRTSGNGGLIYSDAPYRAIIDVTFNF